AGRQSLRFAAQLVGIGAVAPPCLPPLCEAAPSSLLRAGRQEHLKRRIGEYDRPDVPPLDDYSLRVVEGGLALPYVHPVAHLRDGRNLGHSPGHSLGSDRVTRRVSEI